MIRPAIAHDLNAPDDDTRAQLVAASLSAAFNLLAERGASKARPWTPEELAAQIDPVWNAGAVGFPARVARKTGPE